MPSSNSADPALTADAPVIMGDAPSPVWIRRGEKAYRQVGIALFLTGFASFSLVYCVQPLLPAFTEAFHIGPAESSLALSLTTGFLAASIMLAAAFSQRLGRRSLIIASMFLGAALNIGAAFSTSWHGLLWARALEGLMLGGVPAVAMAYLAEEIEPASLGRAMGLYIAGTGLGGMMGRVGMGVLTEFASWRIALAVLGVMCLMATAAVLVLLPPSRNFTPRPGLDIRSHLTAWRGRLRDPALLRIYAIGFVLIGAFTTLFNYAAFRLAEAPFNLGPTATSLIFLSFGFGIVSSAVAGGLADRFGRRPLLFTGFVVMLAAMLLTLLPSLGAIVGGVALAAVGFFIGHSVSSGAVGPLAGSAKGHAASLHLLFYYMGSSIIGTLGGWFWEHGGWFAVVALTGGLAAAGAVLALGVGRPKSMGTTTIHA